jgi:hypothetical protein
MASQVTVRTDFQSCPEFWLELDLSVENNKIRVMGKRGRCPTDLDYKRLIGSEKYSQILHSKNNILVQLDGDYDVDMKHSSSEEEEDQEPKEKPKEQEPKPKRSRKKKLSEKPTNGPTTNKKKRNRIKQE